LAKTGSGTWVLNGPDTNSATGTTTVTGGILNLAKTGATAVSGSLVIGDGLNSVTVLISGTGGNQIANSSVVTFFGTGLTASILRLANASETVAGLVSFDGGIVENEAGALGTATITVDVPTSTAHNFAGILRDGDGAGIDGTLAMVKTGPGTLILTGTNTHTGATAVNAGVLTVDGSISGSTVTVSSASLDGVGTVTGNVTIANGGVVNSSGTN
jgi:fibronectin-binding autotransporter adhesin